jgi:phage terminase small subunit
MTPKQERFVEEYLIDLNATQAAIRAGYSETGAAVQGHENLRNPNVADAISAAMAERSERTKVTADKVVAELGKIAFTDIRKAVRWGKSPIDTKSENADPNGLGMFPVELVPSEEVDDETAAAISEVSLTQAGVKIKMHDKQGALDKLGKHLGMFTDKIEHTGKNGGPIQTEDLSASAEMRGLSALLRKKGMTIEDLGGE